MDTRRTGRGAIQTSGLNPASPVEKKYRAPDATVARTRSIAPDRNFLMRVA
jgi:hypothetical protein